MRTTVFGIRIALAIAILLVAVPIAMGKGLPVERQQQCSGGGNGAAPTLTRVTVDGQDVQVVTVGDNGAISPAIAMGTLYATGKNNGARPNGTDCLSDWVVSLNRSYTGAGPQSGWSSVVGTFPSFLDHAAFAQKWNPAYQDIVPITDASKVVVTITFPETGDFARPNLYWTTAEAKLDGNTPLVFDDAARTVTITGYPRTEITTASRWPTGLEPTYNALAVDQAWYASKGFDTSNFGGGSDNGFGDDGPFGPGGSIAQVSAVGRQFSLSLRFLAAGTGSKGSESQRGMWFETINTPRGAINYNQGALEIGMGNYSEYYADAANTVAESKGALRMFMPDTWTSLGFGVTGASAPEVVQGAIRVTRSEPTEGGGTPTVVNATTTPLPGSGVVLDVGEVGFSLPTYRTARNTAVRAQRKGSKVALTFRLTAKQAKGKVTVFAGTKKLKKVATVKAKKGTNTVTVGYKRGNGYVIKLGKTVIGSAVVR